MTLSVHLQDANRVKIMEVNDKNSIKGFLRHDCNSQDTDLTNRGLDLAVIRSEK